MGISVGETVRVIDKNSSFFGHVGEVWFKGNGNMWQVEAVKGCGVYFSEKQLEKEIQPTKGEQ